MCARNSRLYQMILYIECVRKTILNLFEKVRKTSNKRENKRKQ